jgi:hypothetical protein
MNLFSPIFDEKFIDSVAKKINELANQNPNEPQLQKFAAALKLFIEKYGIKTPSYFGAMKLDLLDMFGKKRRMEEKAIELVFTAYLAILEMQGKLVADDKTLKAIMAIATELVKNGPKVVAKFKEFSAAQKTQTPQLDKQDVGARAKRRFKFMGGFAKGKINTLHESKDPLVRSTLDLLEGHGFLKRDEEGKYQFDDMVDQLSLLLFMLENKFKISEVLSSLDPLNELKQESGWDNLTSEQQQKKIEQKIGQFQDIFYILKNEGWPLTLKRSYDQALVRLVNTGMEDVFHSEPSDPTLLKILFKLFWRNDGEPNLISSISSFHFKNFINEFMRVNTVQGDNNNQQINGEKTAEIFHKILNLPAITLEDKALRSSLIELFKHSVEGEISFRMAYPTFRINEFISKLFSSMPIQAQQQKEVSDFKAELLSAALLSISSLVYDPNLSRKNTAPYNFHLLSKEKQTDLFQLLETHHKYFADLIKAPDTQQNIEQKAFLKILVEKNLFKTMDALPITHKSVVTSVKDTREADNELSKELEKLATNTRALPKKPDHFMG